MKKFYSRLTKPKKVIFLILTGPLFVLLGSAIGFIAGMYAVNFVNNEYEFLGLVGWEGTCASGFFIGFFTFLLLYLLTVFPVFKSKLYSQTEQFVTKTIGKDKNDIIHAKRTVYWVKKLKPDADEALLIAAVAHDIERAIYGDRQKGQDMEKIRAHEEQSAIEIEKFLKTQNAEETLIQRVRHLVIRHEEGGDKDQNILNDADCLAVLEKKTCRWIAENPVEGKKRTDFVFGRIKTEKAKQIAKKFI